MPPICKADSYIDLVVKVSIMYVKSSSWKARSGKPKVRSISFRAS